MKKLIAVSVVIAVGLFLTPNFAFALEADEVNTELRDAMSGLSSEEKAALMEEFRTSVESGEVALTREGADVAGREEGMKEFGEKPDLSTEEGRKEALDRLSEGREEMLGHGFSEDDLKAIEEAISAGREPSEVFERVMGEKGEYPEGMEHGEFMRGEMEGEFGREEFEKMMGGEGRGEVDYREFMRDFEHPEMGPHEFERPEMGPHEFERPELGAPELEHGGLDRPEFEHGEFERPEFERPEFERPEIEREWHGERDEQLFQQQRDQWLEQHPQPQ